MRITLYIIVYNNNSNNNIQWKWYSNKFNINNIMELFAVIIILGLYNNIIPHFIKK